MNSSARGTMTVLCSTEEVPDDAGLRVVLQDYPPLAVFRLEDGFYVIDDTCTHGQASLCDGFLDDGEIECPLHSGRFCIRTGSPTAAPVTVAVRTYQATVVDGNVCVEL